MTNIVSISEFKIKRDGHFKIAIDQFWETKRLADIKHVEEMIITWFKFYSVADTDLGKKITTINLSKWIDKHNLLVGKS